MKNKKKITKVMAVTMAAVAGLMGSAARAETKVADAGQFDNTIRTYIRGAFVTGLYKMHGNEATDGHFPSDVMGGFSAGAGAFIPMAANGLTLRLETVYTFGYIHEPSTNYSAMTFRTGFEINPAGSKVIPYAMIGAGILALDPPKAMVQTGPVVELAGGIRVPLERKKYSMDIGWNVQRGFLNYSEKPNKSKSDRIMGSIGLVKTF